jgi:hypothetical protein
MSAAVAGRALRVAGALLMLASVAAEIRFSGAASVVVTPVAALLRNIATTLRESQPTAVTPPAPQSGDSVALADRFYAAVRQKQFALAASYGSAYLAAHPQADAFAIDLAYAYAAGGRLNDARAVLQDRGAYLRAHPQTAAIWLDLAYKDGAAKRYVRAIDDVDSYLQYRPDDAQARKQRAFYVAAVTPPAPDASALFYAAVAAGQYDRALPLGRAYLDAHPGDDAFAVDLAYAEIAGGRLDAAAAIAQGRAAYFRGNSKAAGLLAALFYAFAKQNQPALAVKYGEEYLALRPDDNAFAMDLAYAQLNLGNLAVARDIAATRPAYLRANPKAALIWMDISYREAAAKQYRAAVADADAYLALAPNDATAKAQRTAYVRDIWGGPRYQAFGYSQYEQRFDDVFFGLDQTYALAPAGRVQPYAALYLTEDLRSGPPGSPQIYSDNALIADVGLRSHLGRYVTAFAEGGAGMGLRGQGTISDLRYGLRYFEQWGARPQPYTSVNASAAFYSRYAGNDIGYYTVLHDFGGKRIRPVIGINGGLDSHNVFGNNYLEGVAGFQTGTDALSFRLLQVEGTYLTRGLVGIPKAQYSSLRASIFFGIAK